MKEQVIYWSLSNNPLHPTRADSLCETENTVRHIDGKKYENYTSQCHSYHKINLVIVLVLNHDAITPTYIPCPKVIKFSKVAETSINPQPMSKDHHWVRVSSNWTTRRAIRVAYEVPCAVTCKSTQQSLYHHHHHHHHHHQHHHHHHHHHAVV